MRKIQSLFVIGLLGSVIGAGIAQAAPADLIKKCEGCHGADGNGSDLNVPNIAGMSDVYIGDTLLAYKAGDRPGIKYKPKDGDESDMATVAKSLSEGDIKAVAAHFGGVAYAELGAATDAHRDLRIEWGKETLIDEPLSELKSLWKNGLAPYY